MMLRHRRWEGWSGHGLLTLSAMIAEDLQVAPFRSGATLSSAGEDLRSMGLPIDVNAWKGQMPELVQKRRIWRCQSYEVITASTNTRNSRILFRKTIYQLLPVLHDLNLKTNGPVPLFMSCVSNPTARYLSHFGSLDRLY